MGKARQAWDLSGRCRHETFRAPFHEHRADARHSIDQTLALCRTHYEERGGQRVRSGAPGRDYRHAHEGRFDRTSQAWIEDVPEAASVALERAFALARGADGGAFCDPDVEERIVGIARIGDDDRPSTIDVPQVPEAARAEIDLRASHTARAEHRQRAVYGVSLANATEIQRGAVSERNRAWSAPHGHT